MNSGTENIKPDFISRFAFNALSAAVKAAGSVLMGLKITQDETVAQWKKNEEGFVILCAHPSELDAIVLLAAASPRYTRFVVGTQQLYKGMQGKLLRAMNVIPKKQFTADISSVKEMIATVRGGQVLGMMPEGRVSPDGTPNPIDISTAKLIKKLRCPVAVLIPHGTYFVKPPYFYSGLKKGKISGELKALFTAEETASLTAEEISNALAKALDYNESEELRGTGRVYGPAEEPMKNVSGLFYRCPACGGLYTIKEEAGRLSCGCGLIKQPTRTMFFTQPAGPAQTASIDTVAAWNKTQLDFEKEFWAEQGAELKLETEKSMLTPGIDADYQKKGRGTIVLSTEKFTYEDEEESIEVPMQSLPGVSADYMLGCIVFYQGDVIRRFFPDEKPSVMRFVNALRVIKGQY